jgi:hypothetical protein
MGFLDFLSSGLTTATDAVNKHDVAVRQQQDRDLQQQLQALQLKRQAEQDALKQQLMQKQMGHLEAQSANLNAKTADTQQPDTPSQQHIVDPVTGEVHFFDPKHPPTGLKVHPQPKSEPVVLVGDPSDPEKPGRYVPKSQAVGQSAPQKPRIQNATDLAASARLNAAVAEMGNAHDSMAEYERKLASGEVQIGNAAQLIGRIANTFTHDDPVSQLAQSQALATLNKTNPELARYIRQGLSFAEGESMISQRPSDFRTKMSAFLALAASGASPDMIADIERRRDRILAPLRETTQTKGKGAGTAGSHSRPPLAERIQQLKGQGLSKEAARAQLQHEGYDLTGAP